VAQFTRVNVSRQAEVPVSAAEYWDALLDWGAVLEWMPKKSPPMPLARCEVLPGQSVSKPPCSRLLYFDKSKLPPGVEPSAIPEQVEETLLYALVSAGRCDAARLRLEDRLDRRSSPQDRSRLAALPS